MTILTIAGGILLACAILAAVLIGIGLFFMACSWVLDHIP